MDTTVTCVSAAAAHLLLAYDSAAKAHAVGNPGVDLIRRAADLLMDGDAPSALARLARARAVFHSLGRRPGSNSTADQDVVYNIDQALRELAPPPSHSGLPSAYNPDAPRSAS